VANVENSKDLYTLPLS